jgi:hypothetical protein
VIVTVDLGKRKAGAATFEDRTLQRASVVREDGGPQAMAKALFSWAKAPEGTVWVVEVPQKYRGRGVKHKDLDALLEVLDALEALVGPAVRYTPWQWKGNVPKAVMKDRLQDQGLLPDWALALGHDALDAIGLGFFYLGLTGKGGARL